MEIDASIQTRLADLKAEFERGKEMLEKLSEQETELRQNMLRISGAIQVLEELAEGRNGGEA